VKPLKIKFGDTDLSIPIGALIGVIISLVLCGFMLFGDLTPEEAYEWILKVLRDGKEIFN